MSKEEIDEFAEGVCRGTVESILADINAEPQKLFVPDYYPYRYSFWLINENPHIVPGEAIASAKQYVATHSGGHVPIARIRKQWATIEDRSDTIVR